MENCLNTDDCLKHFKIWGRQCLLALRSVVAFKAARTTGDREAAVATLGYERRADQKDLMLAASSAKFVWAYMEAGTTWAHFHQLVFSISVILNVCSQTLLSVYGWMSVCVRVISGSVEMRVAEKCVKV